MLTLVFIGIIAVLLAVIAWLGHRLYVQYESLGYGEGYTTRPGIIILNDKSVIIGWDKYSQRIFGFSRPEAIGHNLSLIMPEEMFTAHLFGMERFKATGEQAILNRLILLPARHKNGKIFHIQLLVFTGKGRDGSRTFIGRIWNASDIEEH